MVLSNDIKNKNLKILYLNVFYLIKIKLRYESDQWSFQIDSIGALRKSINNLELSTAPKREPVIAQARFPPNYHKPVKKTLATQVN